MLSTAIVAASVLSQAAMGIKLYSTADIGADVDVDASLATQGDAALAQIDAVAESLQFNSSGLFDLAGAVEEQGENDINRFRNQYEDRNEGLNNGTLDLNTLPDDYSDSGSWSVEDGGEYEADGGEGEWGFNASASFSVSFEHNFRPHTPSPSPSPSPVTPSPSPSPVTPSPSPEPITVNPCDCCDCGDYGVKVPVLFDRGNKDAAKPVYPAVDPTSDLATVTGFITEFHPTGEIKTIRLLDGTV